MKKFSKIFFCTLLSGSVATHTKITPIKLESGILRKFDGILINWKIIRFIKKYTTRMNQFMYTQYTHAGAPCSLFGLVKLEDNHALSNEALHMFSSLADEVISFSEPFLESLQGVKKELVELIEEDCFKRNRNDSILLKWAHVRHGDEHALFKQKIDSYRTLATFCIDILCFLEDLVQSCPKALQRYEHEVTRYNVIRSHIDELLQKDNICLSPTDYKELVQTIMIHYNDNTCATKETTAGLYRTYGAKFIS